MERTWIFTGSPENHAANCEHDVTGSRIDGEMVEDRTLAAGLPS